MLGETGFKLIVHNPIKILTKKNTPQKGWHLTIYMVPTILKYPRRLIHFI